MTYNGLKSIDLTKYVKVLMCFLVSCSNGGGQVSPVRTMAFCRILLSFYSCVQFKIMWLIVCSSFILQGHVELGMNLNLWRYDLVKPWPITVAVNSAEIGNLDFILSFMYGKNNLLTTPFVELCVCVCVCVWKYILFPSFWWAILNTIMDWSVGALRVWQWFNLVTVQLL